MLSRNNRSTPFKINAVRIIGACMAMVKSYHCRPKAMEMCAKAHQCQLFCTWGSIPAHTLSIMMSTKMNAPQNGTMVILALTRACVHLSGRIGILAFPAFLLSGVLSCSVTFFRSLVFRCDFGRLESVYIVDYIPSFPCLKKPQACFNMDLGAVGVTRMYWQV